MCHIYAAPPFKYILDVEPRRASKSNRAAIVADDASVKRTVREGVAIEIDDVIDECATRELQWTSPSAAACDITTTNVGNLILAAEKIVAKRTILRLRELCLVK